MKTLDLMQTSDHTVWAKEFVRMVKNNPAIATDEGCMASWFASAMMAKVDAGRPINGDHIAAMIDEMKQPLN